MRDTIAHFLLLLTALTLATAGLAGAVGWAVSETADRPAPEVETSDSGQSPPDPADLWQVRPGLAIERFATGLQLPVNLGLAPDAASDPTAAFLYVTELYGRVRVLTMDGTVSVYEDGLLNFDPSSDPFPGAGETGVTGIVVEPESGDLFVGLVYLDEADGVVKNRVMRLESSPDGMLAVGEQLVLEGIPARIDHQVQALTIGPDGKLYVNVADGFEPDAAQDDNDLRGKILRLNLDGSIPADNPTPASAVYAKGFRNPFGAAWHPDQPWLYASDNGTFEGDRILKVEPGGNYGWNGSTDSLRQNALLLFDRTNAVSPTAIAFDRDGLLTPAGEAHLFVAVTGPTYALGSVNTGKKILDLRLNAAGEVEEITELLRYVGDGRASVIGIAFGPNGLYFSDLYGEAGFDAGPVVANIYRVFPKDMDGDGDGCTDVEELGSDERFGGRRDPHNFWDFFDADRDGAVAFGDFLLLIQHFGSNDNTGEASINRNSDPLTTPDPGPGSYHPRFDRGDVVGTNPWNLGPPDGTIAFDDFLALIAQYGHVCAGPP